jgi:hypothetical protein
MFYYPILVTRTLISLDEGAAAKATVSVFVVVLSTSA